MTWRPGQAKPRPDNFGELAARWTRGELSLVALCRLCDVADPKTIHRWLRQAGFEKDRHDSVPVWPEAKQRLFEDMARRWQADEIGADAAADFCGVHVTTFKRRCQILGFRKATNRTAKKVRPEGFEAVVPDWNAGKVTLSMLARRYGVCKDVISKWLKDVGAVYPRPKAVERKPPDTFLSIATRWSNGELTTHQSCLKLHVGSGTFYTWCRAAGICKKHRFAARTCRQCGVTFHPRAGNQTCCPSCSMKNARAFEARRAAYKELLTDIPDIEDYRVPALSTEEGAERIAAILGLKEEQSWP